MFYSVSQGSLLQHNQWKPRTIFISVSAKGKYSQKQELSTWIRNSTFWLEQDWNCYEPSRQDTTNAGKIKKLFDKNSGHATRRQVTRPSVVVDRSSYQRISFSIIRNRTSKVTINFCPGINWCSWKVGVWRRCQGLIREIKRSNREAMRVKSTILEKRDKNPKLYASNESIQLERIHK